MASNMIPNKVYQPFQMSHIAEFIDPSAVTYVKNKRGMEVAVPKPGMKLHFAYVNQTISQKYQTLGTEYEDSRIIAVQHNPSLTESMQCKIGDQKYSVLNVSVNDSTYLSYDLVTIKAVKKGR